MRISDRRVCPCNENKQSGYPSGPRAIFAQFEEAASLYLNVSSWVETRA